MTTSMFTAAHSYSAAMFARRLNAAKRRVQIARARADRNPTPTNLEAASELEAGLKRLETEATR